MSDHIYCDDIGSIAITGPNVRLDLMIQSLTAKDAEGKGKLVVEGQVIMPIDGFLRAAARIQAAVQDLEKKGLITRAPKENAAPKDKARAAP
jgi:hypothetical protein